MINNLILFLIYLTTVDLSFVTPFDGNYHLDAVISSWFKEQFTLPIHYI